MKKMTQKTTIFAGASAALAVLALAAFVAAQEPAAPSPQAAARHPRIDRAIAALGLTPDQVKALESFRKARAEERQAYRAEMGRLRTESRKLLGDPQANRAKLDELIDRRAKLRAEREKQGLRARAERDKIFTPEQREKLKAFRASRLGRPGVGGRERMAELRAFRSGYARGWRQGWRRGGNRGWRRW